MGRGDSPASRMPRESEPPSEGELGLRICPLPKPWPGPVRETAARSTSPQESPGSLAARGSYLLPWVMPASTGLRTALLGEKSGWAAVAAPLGASRARLKYTVPQSSSINRFQSSEP
jgi:hypothetical protein